MLQEWCAQFWPQGYYTQFIMALLVSATLVNIRRLDGLMIAGVLWAVWISARLSTQDAAPGIAAMACLIAAIVLFFSRKELASVIATLYVPRIVILSVGQLGLVSHFIMWEINNLIVLVQIALLAGGGHGGTLRRISRIWAYRGGGLARHLDNLQGGFAHMASAVAHRLPFVRKN